MPPSALPLAAKHSLPDPNNQPDGKLPRQGSIDEPDEDVDNMSGLDGVTAEFIYDDVWRPSAVKGIKQWAGSYPQVADAALDLWVPPAPEVFDDSYTAEDETRLPTDWSHWASSRWIVAPILIPGSRERQHRSFRQKRAITQE